MRKTKIVCTMGPATSDLSVMRQIVRAGMDVARLNFSHGTHEDHRKMIETIREAARLEHKIVGIMLDIKGPKIRTGLIENDAVELHDGDSLILTTENIVGTKERISISYEGLPEDVSVGSVIRIDDGLIGLRVVKIENREIHCVVTNGGVLKNRKGINAPGVRLRLPGVTEKDMEDILFGIEQGVDIIAASFVRKAADVLEIRKLLEDHQAKCDIISKIEAQEGLDLIDEIIAVSDGLMVARGDLGVEIPTEEVPIVQKLLIERCNKAGKVVITATQMLDSMQRNPRPTRAEATDVANAIFDGTDAIMLSGETAAGKYPVEAVTTMAQIAVRAEQAIKTREVMGRHRDAVERTQTDAISNAVRSIAEELEARAVVTSTESGFTARMVSKHRPQSAIIAVTPHAAVARRLTLCWGVYPVLVKPTRSTDEMLAVAVDGALASGIVSSGDLIVITAGVPVGEAGTTNLLKIHTIGDVLARGVGVGTKSVVGRAVVAKKAEEILQRVKEGDVLVTVMTDRDMMPAFERASAVITEEGGLTSHAAVVGLSLGIPVIVGAAGVTQVVSDGEIITVDTARGFIYRGKTQVL
ncbi:pyruvate kinase [Sulfoacidibacillus thermotolerans]|uniref:Pyruvate kinase n=1 Tax=Sulfoacidibacillus thermotolerans TaxID=1765684 RepID=A0A2U3D9W2_SULT2|nr:pyruvate kinase [Sulfoacidibacillus thermotolerans]PWI58053.1 pyruvate kinase [Sulfoacidibacillus thermotolerans]